MGQIIWTEEKPLKGYNARIFLGYKTNDGREYGMNLGGWVLLLIILLLIF